MSIKLMFLLIFVSCAKILPSPDKNQITIFHWNIKELTTEKLNDSNNPQLKAVKEVLSSYDFDILSINEIQYDLPGVPSLESKSKGENLTKLAKKIGLNPAEWSQIFSPANTGSFAKRKKNNTYFVEESPLAREHADPVNYGLFPGQYSTAGLIKGDLRYKKTINNLKWIDFNSKAKPSQFRMANGRSLPNDMVLFDKNFNHAVATINEKDIHLIFFHAVPSYGFGNKFTPNFKRNADQLKFLEWYITGSTDFEVTLDRAQWPAITKDSYVIVVGDLNADINQQDSPGAAVIKRLSKTLKPWMQNYEFTNEGSGFSPKPLRLTLDYILSSKNISVVDAGVISPESNYKSLGCNKSDFIKSKRDIRARHKVVEYTDYDSKETCYAAVSLPYYNIKTASDHFPIFAKLSLD